MAAEGPAPVIIKRKKVISGDGHHGGAWKVAYADFVTAMMAFFMLMWLLNATTEKQRKGIADYFNPTIPVNRISGGGEGMFGGTNIFSEEVLARSGTGGVEDGDGSIQAGKKQARQELKDLSSALKAAAMQKSGGGPRAEQLSTKLVEDGLAIDLFDIDDAQIFQKDTADLSHEGAQLLSIVAEVLSKQPHVLTITGHTPPQPVVVRKNRLWALSVNRALAGRRYLQRAGLPAERIVQLGGQADRVPFFMPPASIGNNRLRILVRR
ncbi:MAG: flagellar motor protein MotB [Pseudomonadota bacterium]